MQEHFSVGVHSFLPVNNREARVQGYVHSFFPVYIKMQEHFSVGPGTFAFDNADDAFAFDNALT